MTFTTMLKDEISRQNDHILQKRVLLISYLNLIAKIDSEIFIASETASVIRKIYTDLKEVYDINPKILIRIQNRFKKKQIYILIIKEKVNFIKSSIKYSNILDILETEEDRISFLKGAFMAVGSISDPKTSGYHLEFSCSKRKYAADIKKVLSTFKFRSKVIIRNNKYITYIKSSDDMSDMIKLFQTINSLFYFEDIRIYRDHKNMVNRLNNCEVANQEKTIKTGLRQLDAIEYLKKHDLINLLDDKVKTVVLMREKYPEASYVELAEIISLETDYKIGKSGINHNFIKINDMINKHMEVQNGE